MSTLHPNAGTAINYADSPFNLSITNDLSTGNILFSGEKHNIPPQVLGTLVAEEDPRSDDVKPRIRIKRMNDDGTLDRYLLRRKPAFRIFCFQEGDQAPSRVSMADNRADMIAEVLAYLNNLFTEVPATTSTILEFGPDDTLDAARDATNTTVLFDNGKEHAVNAILAVQNEVGLIDVVDHATQQIHFRNVRHDKVTIVGSAAGNNVISVINALNALFTVNPLGAGYVPTEILPTLEGVEITYNQAEETIPSTDDPLTGNDHLQVATGNDPHGSRLWSNEMIDEAGEYFDFKITGKGQFLLGFYEIGVDEANLAEGTTGNHHTGMFWSLSLYNYGSYMGPHTIYGRSPGLAYGPGWNGNQNSRYATNGEIQDNHENLYPNLWRAGIDTNGYLYVAYYDAGRTNSYIMVARRSALHDGSKQFGFACKLINGNATLVEAPFRTAVDPTGPALAYRYIESPDGQFYYPLFASADEAAYVDVQNGGTEPGSAHTHTFIDEPTGAVWYMPDNGGTHAGPSAPSDSAGVVYTEIPTLADDQFAPAAFTLTPITANEGDSINIPLHDAGSSPSSFTTTVDASTLPSGIVNTGAQNRFLQGTLPAVSSDTTFNVLVTRANAYGSTQAYQEINIVNVPVPVSGWTVHQGIHLGGNVVAATENAVLSYDTPISRGTRVRIPFEAYMKLGIVTSAGDNIKATGDLFQNTARETNFQLLVTVWANGTLNHNNNQGVGWDYNNQITQPTAENTDVYFLDYKTDGFIEFINSDTGEVLVTSQLAYSGDLTLFSGTPDNYSVNTTIPSITTEDLSFTGGAINGFTKDGTGEDLIDASTLADGSVVNLDATLDNNFRVIIRKEWLEANVLPGLAAANGISQFFIGFPNAGADWTALTAGNGNVAAEDFKLAFGIAMTDADITHNRNNNGYKIKLYKDGTQVHNMNVTASPITHSVHDLVFSYVDGRMEMGLAHTYLTTSDTEAREEDGGSSWQLLVPYNGFGTGAQTLFFGAQNTQADLSLTGIDFVREPFLVRDIIVGETSNGSLKFTEIQPSATVFDSVPSGHADFAGTFIGPTLNAGQAYRFIYHPSLEGTDAIKVILASDNSDYTDGVTFFGSGDPATTSDYKGLEFVVPSDAPPVKIAWLNSYQGNTTYTSGVELPISGSTYTVDVTGIDLIGPSGNISGNTLDGSAWFKLTETLGAGERLVIGGAQLQEIYDAMGNGDNVFVGLKGAGWSESSTEADLEGVYLKIHKPSYGGYFLGIYGDYGTNYQYASSSYTGIPTEWSAFIELTSTGNNIRMGAALSTSADPATTIYSNWPSNSGGLKNQTGDQGFGFTAEDVVFYFKRFAQDFDTAGVTWTDLQEVANPSVATILTPFTKALDFSGSAERVKQVGSSTDYKPLTMNGLATTTSAPAGGVTTSLDGDARPWATAIVFKADGNNSNQHIWNQGEGEGTGNDNIYVRLSASKNLYFGWGREGSVNECQITSGGVIATNQWYGLYIGHNGTRLSSSDATAANLADCFDIYLMSSADNFNAVGNNLSTESTWLNTGDRMDRTIEGDFTIGGRGSNRNFHGKVASMVVTVLRRSYYMPGDAEIKLMIADPKRWEDDYRVGNTVRQSTGGGNTGYNPASMANGYGGTQIWLMGDGTSDAFAQIRNQVNLEQNYTPLNMISMVANDVETVNIPGLS